MVPQILIAEVPDYAGFKLAATVSQLAHFSLVGLALHFDAGNHLHDAAAHLVSCTASPITGTSCGGRYGVAKPSQRVHGDNELELAGFL